MNKAEAIQLIKTTDDQNTINVVLNFSNNDTLLALLENKHITAEQKQYIIDKADFTNYEIMSDLSKDLVNSKNSKTRLLNVRSSAILTDALIDILINEQLDEIKSIAASKIMNRDLSETQLQRLIKANRYTLMIAIQHESCSSDTLVEIFNEYNTDNEIISIIAKNPNCPVNISMDNNNLNSDISEYLRKKLASNTLSVNDINYIINNYTIDDTVLITILSHSNCPTDILYKFTTHSRGNVRKAIAENINCPVDILNYLIDDKNKAVRSAVVHHKNCTPEIWSKLLNNERDTDYLLDYYNYWSAYSFDLLYMMFITKHDSHKLRDHLKHITLSDDQISKCENSNIPFLHMLAVKNLGCTESRLRELAQYDDEETLNFVLNQENCPIDVLNKISNKNLPDVRRHIIKHNNCTVDILNKLSDDEDQYVRGAIAKHEDCPESILVKLANDPNEYVRASVADNHNCPENILAKLADDSNKYVRMCVADNDNCPINVLNTLVEDDAVNDNVISNKNCPSTGLITYISLTYVYKKDTIDCIMTHPNCTEEVLCKLVELSEKYDYVMKYAIDNNKYNDTMYEVLFNRISEDNDKYRVYTIVKYSLKTMPKYIIKKILDSKDIIDKCNTYGSSFKDRLAECL